MSTILPSVPNPAGAIRSRAFPHGRAGPPADVVSRGVRATPLADRCARALRWIVPSFVLIPIAWLEIEDASPGWVFWLATLVAVSLGLVALSSTLQWRPFLLSGLLGLLEAAVRGFMRLDRHLEDPALARIGLMSAIALAGIATMVTATAPERPVESLRGLLRRGKSASG